MDDSRPRTCRLSPRLTLVLILLPLLCTFAAMRLYLHGVGVQHVYPGGYLFHHLFTGTLMIMPAAFVLAFDTRRRAVAIGARVALGIGSALVLDEITFLVMTQASDEDYVSAVSFVGGLIFVALSMVVLCALYGWRRGWDG